jgi:hypothetical protein
MGPIEDCFKAMEVGIAFLRERQVGTTLPKKIVPGKAWRVDLILDPVFALVLMVARLRLGFLTWTDLVSSTRF